VTFWIFCQQKISKKKKSNQFTKMSAKIQELDLGLKEKSTLQRSTDSSRSDEVASQRLNHPVGLHQKSITKEEKEMDDYSINEIEHLQLEDTPISHPTRPVQVKVPNIQERIKQFTTQNSFKTKCDKCGSILIPKSEELQNNSSESTKSLYKSVGGLMVRNL